MELVVLREVMSSYALTWVNVAATEDLRKLERGDTFREVGFGEGAEEVRVEVFEISPIPGGSRVQLLRAYNRTKPQPYRVGAVLRRLNEPALVHEQWERVPEKLPDLLDEIAVPEVARRRRR